MSSNERNLHQKVFEYAVSRDFKFSVFDCARFHGVGLLVIVKTIDRLISHFNKSDRRDFANRLTAQLSEFEEQVVQRNQQSNTSEVPKIISGHPTKILHALDKKISSQNSQWNPRGQQLTMEWFDDLEKDKGCDSVWWNRKFDEWTLNQPMRLYLLPRTPTYSEKKCESESWPTYLRFVARAKPLGILVAVDYHVDKIYGNTRWHRLTADNAVASVVESKEQLEHCKSLLRHFQVTILSYDPIIGHT